MVLNIFTNYHQKNHHMEEKYTKCKMPTFLSRSECELLRRFWAAELIVGEQTKVVASAWIKTLQGVMGDPLQSVGEAPSWVLGLGSQVTREQLGKGVGGGPGVVFRPSVRDLNTLPSLRSDGSRRWKSSLQLQCKTVLTF